MSSNRTTTWYQVDKPILPGGNLRIEHVDSFDPEEIAEAALEKYMMTTDQDFIDGSSYTVFLFENEDDEKPFATLEVHIVMEISYVAESVEHDDEDEEEDADEN